MGVRNASFSPNSTPFMRFCSTFATRINARRICGVNSRSGNNASGDTIAGHRNRRNNTPAARLRKEKEKQYKNHHHHTKSNVRLSWKLFLDGISDDGKRLSQRRRQLREVTRNRLQERLYKLDEPLLCLCNFLQAKIKTNIKKKLTFDSFGCCHRTGSSSTSGGF